MSKTYNISTKYFPFAPGIPWKIKNTKYVLPKVPFVSLDEAFKNKDLIVVCFGDILESFYSLSILEHLNKKFTKNTLYWCGDVEHHNLIHINGLAKPLNIITEDVLKRFPTPIFMDMENRVYFNSMYNVHKKRAYFKSTGGFKVYSPIIKQISDNSCMPWDIDLLPKTRRHKWFAANQEAKSKKIDLKNFVLLIPDVVHKTEKLSLGWSPQDIKTFCSIAKGRVVILSNTNYAIHGLKIPQMPLTLDNFFFLSERAKAILSESIELSLIALSINDNLIFGLRRYDEYSLIKNNKFLNNKNIIYANKTISPIEVSNTLKGRGII